MLRAGCSADPRQELIARLGKDRLRADLRIEDDASGMRGRLAHAYALWGAERPPALLLSEPFERLSL